MEMQITRGFINKGQKVVIYGTEGIGKSSLASQFPSPVFIDTEGSTSNLDVARTPKPTSWQMLKDQIFWFKTQPHEFKTLVIDTMDWAEQMAVEKVCADHGKVGIEQFGYGQGYTYVWEEIGRLLNLLQELVDQRGMHVVLTAHSQIVRFEQPEEMGSYDRYELKMGKKTGKQTSSLVKEWADMVLFANFKTVVINVDGKGASKGKNKAQGNERVIYTTHHQNWDAKNRHGLPPEIPMDYSQISHIFNAPITSQPMMQTTPLVQSLQPDQQQAPPNQNQPIQQKNPQGQQAPPITSTPQEQPQSQPGQMQLQQDPIPETLQQDQTQSTQSPPSQDASIPPDMVPVDDPDSPWQMDNIEELPQALQDLMKANGISGTEIRAVVAKRGYFPEDTPIKNYPPDFISGVLVAAWPQIMAAITEYRNEVPF